MHLSYEEYVDLFKEANKSATGAEFLPNQIRYHIRDWEAKGNTTIDDDTFLVEYVSRANYGYNIKYFATNFYKFGFINSAHSLHFTRHFAKFISQVESISLPEKYFPYAAVHQTRRYTNEWNRVLNHYVRRGPDSSKIADRFSFLTFGINMQVASSWFAYELSDSFLIHLAVFELRWLASLARMGTPKQIKGIRSIVKHYNTNGNIMELIDTLVEEGKISEEEANRLREMLTTTVEGFKIPRRRKSCSIVEFWEAV